MSKQEIIKYLENYKASYQKLEKEHVEKYGDNYDDRTLDFIRIRLETYSDILFDIFRGEIHNGK